jgi:hypothetical protein
LADLFISQKKYGALANPNEHSGFVYHQTLHTKKHPANLYDIKNRETLKGAR